MSINEIIQELEVLRGDAEGKVVLYFTKKGRREKYFSFKAQISGALQEELIEIIIKALENIKDLPSRHFNPLGSLDDTLEVCDYDYVKSFEHIRDSMEETNLLPDAYDDLSAFTFYTIKIKFDSEEIEDFLFFRRVTKFKKLQKGIAGNIVNGEFKKVSNDLIGIDSAVDIIGDGSVLTVANHIALERIFDIKDQYQESAKETLEIIKKTEMIENFNDFYEDSIADGRVIRGLTKILKDPDRVREVHENFDRVVELVNNMDLEISFNDKQTKMIYEDKAQLQKITFILRDAYYQTFIREQTGLDEMA